MHRHSYFLGKKICSFSFLGTYDSVYAYELEHRPIFFFQLPDFNSNTTPTLLPTRSLSRPLPYPNHGPLCGSDPTTPTQPPSHLTFPVTLSVLSFLLSLFCLLAHSPDLFQEHSSIFFVKRLLVWLSFDILEMIVDWWYVQHAVMWLWYLPPFLLIYLFIFTLKKKMVSKNQAEGSIIPVI